MNRRIQAVRAGDAPRLYLGVFMFSLAFESFNLAGAHGNLSVGQITGLAYAASLFLTGKIRLPRRAAPLTLVLLLLILTFFVASLVNLNKYSGKVFDAPLLQNSILVLLLIGHERNDPGAIKRSFVMYAVGMAVASACYMLGIGTEYMFGRLKLFGDDSNYTAVKASIAVIVILYLNFFRRRPGTPARLLLAFIAPLSLLIVETGSRSGVIALVGMLLVLLLVYWMEDPARRTAKVMILAVAAVAGLAYLFSTSELLQSRFLDTYYEQDLSERDLIWEKLLPLYHRNPILGYGYSGYERESIFLFSAYKNAHNTIIETLMLGGSIGISVFATLNILVLVYSWRSVCSSGSRLAPALLVAYFACLMSLQFYTFKLLWIVLAFNCTHLAARMDLQSMARA